MGNHTSLIKVQAFLPKAPSMDGGAWGPGLRAPLPAPHRQPGRANLGVTPSRAPLSPALTVWVPCTRRLPVGNLKAEPCGEVGGWARSAVGGEFREMKP